VGQHTHSGQFNHTHPLTVVSGAGATFGVLFGTGASAFVQTGGYSGGFLSIDNAGTVPGTNAPYIQLKACRKD
jgi:hypothetical protein